MSLEVEFTAPPSLLELQSENEQPDTVTAAPAVLILALTAPPFTTAVQPVNVHPVRVVSPDLADTAPPFPLALHSENEHPDTVVATKMDEPGIKLMAPPSLTELPVVLALHLVKVLLLKAFSVAVEDIAPPPLVELLPLLHSLKEQSVTVKDVPAEVLYRLTAPPPLPAAQLLKSHSVMVNCFAVVSNAPPLPLPFRAEQLLKLQFLRTAVGEVSVIML